MLVLLQFDAASLEMVEEMSSQGRLPHLQSLRERGTWQSLDCAATFLQSSTYPTLYTGVDVREHGIYSTFPWSPSDQRVKHAHTFTKPRTLWERLTASGKRSLVIDPYISWAPISMSGVFLSGFQFEDRMALRSAFVPRASATTLSRSHGKPPELHDVYGRHDLDSLDEMAARLAEGPHRAATVVTSALSRESFDLVWVNFAGSHKGGHHLWNAAASTGEVVNPERSAAIRGGLENIYVAIDAAIGEIVQSIPASSDVIVFSPTGMNANTSRADLLPGMLEAVLNPGSQRQRKTSATGKAPVWKLRSAIPVGLRSRIAGALPDSLVADLTTRLHMRADWKTTRAFTIPGENKGYIRVNMKDRERQGIVSTADFDELTGSIIDGLMTFSDIEGSGAVTKVERTRDMAGGKEISPLLPDLVVFWGDSPPVDMTGVVSSRYGEVRRTGIGSGRSGNHVDDAWAVLVPGGSRLSATTRPPRITDIAATACSLLGADLNGLSGEPLLETQR